MAAEKKKHTRPLQPTTRAGPFFRAARARDHNRYAQTDRQVSLFRCSENHAKIVYTLLIGSE